MTINPKRTDLKRISENIYTKLGTKKEKMTLVIGARCKDSEKTYANVEKMTFEAKKVVDEYLAWLKDNMRFKNIKDDIISIDSPFLDSHNDHIRLYIKYNSKSNNFIITDDGFSILDVMQSGVKIEGSREKILKTFINGLGIKYDDKTHELYVESTQATLPAKKHKLMQGILNVGDMFILSEPHVKNLFYEDVRSFFESKEIAATSVVDINGQSREWMCPACMMNYYLNRT